MNTREPSSAAGVVTQADLRARLTRLVEAGRALKIVPAAPLEGSRALTLSEKLYVAELCLAELDAGLENMAYLRFGRLVAGPVDGEPACAETDLERDNRVRKIVHEEVKFKVLLDVQPEEGGASHTVVTVGFAGPPAGKGFVNACRDRQYLLVKTGAWQPQAGPGVGDMFLVRCQPDGTLALQPGGTPVPPEVVVGWAALRQIDVKELTKMAAEREEVRAREAGSTAPLSPGAAAALGAALLGARAAVDADLKPVGA